ncbi:CinA family protein [bacterium]|nr:MAG: CinA family protein [bacterium]
MVNIALKIHRNLLKKKAKIAVAESCTGGLLSALLTQYSGSSRYFILGLITYSNQSKEKLFKIPPSFIAKNSAISQPVAIAMARKVRMLAKSDFGVGISGIAGPTGSSCRKPVGTVFIAINGKAKTLSGEFHFRGTRIQIRKMAALKSLALLNRLL